MGTGGACVNAFSPGSAGAEGTSTLGEDLEKLAWQTSAGRPAKAGEDSVSDRLKIGPRSPAQSPICRCPPHTVCRSSAAKGAANSGANRSGFRVAERGRRVEL